MTESAAGTRIHPSAIVEKGAELGAGVEIGPYCLVSKSARIGDRTKLHGFAQIQSRVTIGCDNEIFSGAILGGTPQDRSYHGEETEVVIGDRNLIREHVTVHLGTRKGSGVTRLGSDCLIMCGTHIAHDCRVEDQVTIGNNTLIAGHVHIESKATVAGGSGVHHWCTIGTMAFVGGLARVAMDVPPYLIVEGRPGRIRGFNIVGVGRGLADVKRVDALREAYRILFHASETREAAYRAIESAALDTEEVRHLVASLRRSDQGYRGRYLEGIARGYLPPETEDDMEELNKVF